MDDNDLRKQIQKAEELSKLLNNTGKIIQTGTNMVGNNFKIITLCGSTKFKKEFEEIYKKLSLEGNIVLTVACFGHVDSPEVFKTPGLKDMLDEMHKEKIRMSDGIFVINPNNYIGNSTKNEIEYAKSINKNIQYLEDPISKE